MDADPYASRVAAVHFDAARNQFLHAVDLLLAEPALDPETRANEVRATVRVLQDKLRLMEW